MQHKPENNGNYAERKENRQRQGNNLFTFPCWLLVTLRVCVTVPLPLAGRVLPLAGSKCS